MKRIVSTLIVFLVPICVAQGAGKLTARQVVERIQKHVGTAWNAETVDTFKMGNPDTPVTGIATTFMATLDVLERAAASGKNFVISHEPTFYTHLDHTDAFANDPVFLAKEAFIEKHGMVVWRFHDHWHMRKPDGVLVGVTDALGWKKFQTKVNEPYYVLPETTVAGLAASIRDRMKIRTIRVVGDPKMKVTKVGLAMGASGTEAHISMLRRDDVEALVIGESPEWETIPYVRDAVSECRHKALIVLGHVPSEEAGMDECARWLKTFVPEVPVEFIPAGEPFWSPK